jgi:hypothetical protein
MRPSPNNGQSHLLRIDSGLHAKLQRGLVDWQPRDSGIQIELVSFRSAFEALKTVPPQVGRKRAAGR